LEGAILAAANHAPLAVLLAGIAFELPSVAPEPGRRLPLAALVKADARENRPLSKAL
jgi:hypothetical protein